MKSLRPILGDCWVVSVMPRYISCPAKLVCLVSESSFPVLFCRDVSCRCRAPVICPPLPLSQLFVAGALLTLHWAAGRGAGGKRVGNSQCSKSRCRPWLNTRAGSAARAGTPANYLDTELSLVDPPCVIGLPCRLSCLPRVSNRCHMAKPGPSHVQETWNKAGGETVLNMKCPSCSSS